MKKDALLISQAFACWIWHSTNQIVRCRNIIGPVPPFLAIKRSHSIVVKHVSYRTALSNACQLYFTEVLVLMFGRFLPST